MSNNNKMTKCKVCGKDVAKGAKRCPSCGHDQRSFFGKHKIITVILIFFVLGAIGSAFGGFIKYIIYNFNNTVYRADNRARRRCSYRIQICFKKG